MEKKMRHYRNYLKTIVLAVFGFFIVSSGVKSETWVDIDGGSYVEIENGNLAIHDLSSFFYFDELFRYVRSGGVLRLCIGEDNGSGMATDCLGVFTPRAGFNNEGKNRSLHFDIQNFSTIIKMFEDALVDGSAMKLSIDNGDLFYSTTISKSYVLGDAAVAVLKLVD